MRIGLTDEQEMLRSTTRHYLETTAPPTKVREWAAATDGFERAWWQGGAELGWCSLFASNEHSTSLGGAAQTAAILAEELGRAVSPGPFLPANVVVDALARTGSASQQEQWLPGLLAGEVLGAWVIEEPGWTRDGGTCGITARRVSDGYVLDGETRFVEAAGTADLLLVSAQSDGGSPIQLLVPATSGGVTTSNMEGLDLVRRFGFVRFENVRVPADSVLGRPGQDARRDRRRQLNVALTLQAAETVGLMDRVFEFTFDYMKDRYSYGRPIASYQALKHAVADMLLKLESAKAITDAAADAIDRDDDPTLDVSIAAAYVKEEAVHVIQTCVQLLGGIAMTWEHDVHLYLRRATLNRAVFGPPDQHREQIAELTV